MCTDYEVMYACGHKGQPARTDGPDATAIYAGCTDNSPTARVTSKCKQFQKSSKVCSPQKRTVITQTFPIFCDGERKCPRTVSYPDDVGCKLLQGIEAGGSTNNHEWIRDLTDREKANMNKANVKFCQPPVWGRKGPHVKKQRRVKTKEEKEIEKKKEEVLKKQKELEKLKKEERKEEERRKKEEEKKKKREEKQRKAEEKQAGKKKAGRQKNVDAVETQDVPAVVTKPRGRKRKADNDDDAAAVPETQPRRKAEPKAKKQKIGIQKSVSIGTNTKVKAASTNASTATTAAAVTPKKATNKKKALTSPPQTRASKRKAAEELERPVLATRPYAKRQKLVVVLDDDAPTGS
ncbi:hypothetical protein Dda_2113 [Drechslerella dactyloides]|uniref:Uncharacterized protein n=1 Tax=Drechslerella dactyloides TaxID=74499 RepID=A0AAD6J2X7_DREDA|nr:hypothetical protein Dda_2113 [Drechslerella dactyloides]